jgi:hypothetical protein
MMDRECSTHGGDEKCIQNLSESLKGRYNSEDLVKDGRMILKWILGKKGWRVWIGSSWLRTGTRDQWQALVKMKINLQFP